MKCGREDFKNEVCNDNGEKSVDRSRRICEEVNSCSLRGVYGSEPLYDLCVEWLDLNGE